MVCNKNNQCLRKRRDASSTQYQLSGILMKTTVRCFVSQFSISVHFIDIAESVAAVMHANSGAG